MAKLKIVGLGGSLAKVSSSRAVLAIALAGAEEAGAEVELLDLRELDLPMYNPDDDELTPTAVRLVETMHGADGHLWCSPLYQGTVSGAFKNAIDWLHILGGWEPPHLADKVIGLISAAGGTQGLQAINTMEFSVRAVRAWAVPFVVPVPSAARLVDDQGRLQDEAIERQLKMLGSEVVRVADRFQLEESPDHEAECEKARKRVAAAA